MLRHLIIGPVPCIFEIHEYRMFLQSVCVGKQDIGLVSDPFPKGHEIPPSSSIYTALRASFRLWDLFRLKVRHSCNFAYFVCVQRPDKGVTEPHLDQESFHLIFAISRLQSQFLACSLFARRKQALVVRLIVLRRGQ